MKNILKLYLILFVFLSAFNIYAQQAQQQPLRYSPYYYHKKSHFETLPNAANEIIFLGDSLIDGCNWNELFQDPRIKNRGIGGDITEGILIRLKEVTESQPAKIFLMIGINDLAMGRQVPDVVNNIQTIIKKIRSSSPRTQIYLQSLLPVNSDFGMFPNHTNKGSAVLAVNDRLKNLAEKFETTYIDIHSVLVNKEGELNPNYTYDGLHITGEGYMIWKRQLRDYIN